MKNRYRLVLSIGITFLLTATLFLPIPTHVQEPKPTTPAKAATISLVDRIAIAQPMANEPPATEEIQAEEQTLSPIPLPIQEETGEQAQAEEPKPKQIEKHAASELAEESKPTLIDGYYAVESVTTAPVFDRALLASRIVYPPLAKRQRKEGLVILSLFIAESGIVERVVVEEDPGYGLSEAAVAAFTSFQASPALYNNEAVAVTLRYPIRYALR